MSNTPAHPVGTIVRSHLRSPWTGVVVASGRDHVFTQTGTIPTSKGEHPIYHAIAVSRENQVVRVDYDETRGWVQPEGLPWGFLNQPTNVMVEITHDKRGKPMRKPQWVVLDSGWLTPVLP